MFSNVSLSNYFSATVCSEVSTVGSVFTLITLYSFLAGSFLRLADSTQLVAGSFLRLADSTQRVAGSFLCVAAAATQILCQDNKFYVRIINIMSG